MKYETQDPPLAALKIQFDLNDIDLQPEFQRGFIWDRKKQEKLIDTVLRGWHMPPVHVRKLAFGQKPREEVLDGQQRLTTLKRFLQGCLEIDGHIDPKDTEIEKLHGCTFARLPSEWRDEVSQYTVRKIVIENISPPEASEIFQRLNIGTRTNAVEFRNALIGPVRDYVKKTMSQHRLFSPKLIGIKDDGRLKYHDLAAKMLFLAKNNGFQLPPNAKQLLTWYRSQGQLDNKLTQSVESTLDFIAEGLEKKGGFTFTTAVLLSLFWVMHDLRLKYYFKATSEEFLDIVIEFESWRQKEKEKAKEGERHAKANAFNESVRAHTTDVDSFKVRDTILRDVISRNILLTLKDPKRVYSEQQRKDIYSKDKGQCFFCGEKVSPAEFDVHHITVWAAGGQTTTENGAIAHKSCNRSQTFVPA